MEEERGAVKGGGGEGLLVEEMGKGVISRSWG